MNELIAQLPSLQRLTTLYGENLERTTKADKLRLLLTVSLGIYTSQEEGQSDYLSNIAEYEGYEFADHEEVMAILYDLDAELDEALAFDLAKLLLAQLSQGFFLDEARHTQSYLPQSPLARGATKLGRPVTPISTFF
jgi:hypothetical protein